MCAGYRPVDVHPALCDRLLARMAVWQQHVARGRSYGSHLRGRCAVAADSALCAVQHIVFVVVVGSLVCF